MTIRRRSGLFLLVGVIVWKGSVTSALLGNRRLMAELSLPLRSSSARTLSISDERATTEKDEELIHQDVNPYGTGETLSHSATSSSSSSSLSSSSTSSTISARNPSSSRSTESTDSTNATATTKSDHNNKTTTTALSKTKGNSSSSATTSTEEDSDMDDQSDDASHFSQWDITNHTDFDAVFRNQTASRTPLLPPEEEQPDTWPMIVVGLFVGLSLLLCLGTAFKRYRASRRLGYEPVQNLTV